MKKRIFLSIYLVSLFSFSQKKLHVDYMSDFQNGYAIVNKGNVTTFLDTLGNLLEINNINLKLDKNTPENGMQKNGFFISTEEKYSGNCGIKNLKGEYIVEPKYRISLLNGYYIVNDVSDIFNQTYNILDDNCNSIYTISKSFRNKTPVIPLTNNIIAISNNEGYPFRYKLIFIAENRETDYIYSDFGKTNNDLIKASKYIKNDGKIKWGFLDERGKKVIDFIYTKRPGNFDNNLAVVKNSEGEFGYINNENKIVIETNLIEAYGFINKKALIRIHKYQRKNGEINNGYRIINTKGQIIYDLKDLKPNFIPYDYYKQTIIEKNNILRLINTKSKRFILNLDKLELIQTEFSQINEFNSGLSLVKFFDSEHKLQIGYANKKGKLVFIKSKREF